MIQQQLLAAISYESDCIYCCHLNVQMLSPKCPTSVTHRCLEKIVTQTPVTLLFDTQNDAGPHISRYL